MTDVTNPPQAKILVVDDDSLLREMLADILIAEKFDVVTAENGKEALEMCTQNSDIEIVVSDLHMPVMGGLDLIKALRESGSKIPLIILSGNDEISMALDAVRSGADDYLMKSGNIDETLLLAVESALEKKRIVDQNTHLMKELKEKNKELNKLNDFIKNALKKYLAPDYVDILINKPEMLDLGGKEREITMMFTDIQSFTMIAEGMSPEKLVIMLNEYLNGMTEILQRHGGTLDKYAGDGIVAFWNAPLSQENHASSAISAALEMDELCHSLRESFIQKGQLPLKTRIGINTGKAIVGNIGSKNRFDYTAIGDAVNLASRLEELNKWYGTYLLISDSVLQMSKDSFRTRELDLLRVKGKQIPVKIHELLGHAGKKFDSTFESLLEYYDKGLTAYKNGQWEEGLRLFSLALEYDYRDSVSRIYLDRCRIMQQTPPGEEWNGVFDLQLNRRKSDPLAIKSRK